MNWRLVILSLLQSFLLVCGQVSLKLALVRTPKWEFAWPTIKAWFLNYWFLFCGIFFGAATVLWMHILKHFPFSIAYPLTSFAYVFGLVAGIMVFKEPGSWTKWAGVLLILVGSFLLIRK